MTYSTTEDGEVYAPPERLPKFVSTDPNTFSDQVSTTDGPPSTWQLKLEGLQADAKGLVDDIAGRDFEDHPNETVTLDGGERMVLELPGPIQSVDAVRVNGDPLPDDEEFVVRDRQLFRVRDTERLAWPAGFDSVEVDLSWGYEQAPRVVQRAELMIVDHTLIGMAQKREEMVVQAGDGPSATVNIPESINREIRDMLSTYRPTGNVAGML